METEKNTLPDAAAQDPGPISPEAVEETTGLTDVLAQAVKDVGADEVMIGAEAALQVIAHVLGAL